MHGKFETFPPLLARVLPGRVELASSYYRKIFEYDEQYAQHFLRLLLMAVQSADSSVDELMSRTSSALLDLQPGDTSENKKVLQVLFFNLERMLEC